MSEMVERVARVLYAADDCGRWSDDPGLHSGDCTKEAHTCLLCLQTEYLAKARAAIAAMRNPPLEVLAAGYNAEPVPSMRADIPHYLRAWRAMIDAALKP